MAVNTLTGSDWNTAAHWSLGSVPVGAQDVMLGPNSPALLTPPSGANQNVKLGTFLQHPLYKYAAASSGAPIEISATQILLFGAGDFFFKCDGGGASNKTNRIIVKTPGFNAGQVIELGAAAVPGEIDYLSVLRGNVALTDATGLDKVLVGSVNNPSGDAVLTIGSGTATIPLVIADGGRVNCSATVTDARLGGAYWTQLLNTLTKVYANHGVLAFNSNATVALADIDGDATLDLTQDVLVKTFTELNLYAKARFLYWPATTVHVLTAFNDYREAA